MDIKSAIRFVLSCLVFTVIFWTTWLFALRPIFYGGADAAEKTSQTRDEALREKYLEQTQRVDELQAQYERQLEAGSATLKRQDELLSRWEKVIQRWEAVAPQKK